MAKINLHDEKFGYVVAIFLTTLAIVICVGVCFIFMKDKRPSPRNRKEYCEYVLKEKYGKEFTIDKIYGGDYSGIYYAKAHADDNPNFVFTICTNRKSDSLDDFRDEYLERSQEAEYKKEFDEIFGGYGIDYYFDIEVINKALDYDNPNYKMYVSGIFVSSEWLSDDDDEIWTAAKMIAEKYGNYHMVFVTDEDLQRIKDEYSGTDQLDESTKSYLNERYSIEWDSGELHQGTLIVSADDYDEFISDMEQIRKNELFR